MAINKHTTTAEKIVNECIYKQFKNIKYNNIVTLQYDSNGKISSISSDISKMNLLKSELSVNLINALNENDIFYVYVPIIHVFGNTLFSDFAFRLKVRVYILNDFDIDFQSAFSSAGINQTKHDINVSVKAKFIIVIPGRKADKTIKTTVPIAQTIIVGDIPQSYVNVTSDPAEVKNDILQLAPNQ